MSIYDKMADSHWALRRGRVFCRKCGRAQWVNSAHCLANGWPECCGETMSLQSAKEQARRQDVAALVKRKGMS